MREGSGVSTPWGLRDIRPLAFERLQVIALSAERAPYRLRSTEGALVCTSKWLLVALGALAAPVISATAAQGSSFRVSPTSPVEGQVVRLLAEHCRACSYRWVQVKGQERVRLGAGRVLRIKFSSPGRETVRLTVRKPDGDRTTTVRSLSITALSAVNLGRKRRTSPPTAAFTYSPTRPTAGEELIFDASSSSCAATPCDYRWEDDGPDGPGGSQWPLGTGQNARFRFTEPGAIHVRLIVTDRKHRSDAAVQTFSVGTAPAPTRLQLRPRLRPRLQLRPRLRPRLQLRLQLRPGPQPAAPRSALMCLWCRQRKQLRSSPFAGAVRSERVRYHPAG